jgi:two-component system nitrogen regulation sensor histidine kinase GlnL
VLSFAGLDLLATAVVVLDDDFIVRYANPAAENLLTTGAKSLIGHPFLEFFAERRDLERALEEARITHWDYSAQNVTYIRGGRIEGRLEVPLSCTVTRIDAFGLGLLAELRPIEQQLRQAREERLASEQQASRELIRNLAHEIKNPLGGLRGSAQLLEGELGQLRLPGGRGEELREYTQVIIKEADRLQALMDRMLIQAVLNIVRNAAQAGSRTVLLRTRALRQVTILKLRHKLALELQVVDDGPGVPDEIQDRIFNPLVSGREGGTGLGLSLAQTFVQYHQGVIEFESRPGRTIFRILLPLT